MAEDKNSEFDINEALKDENVPGQGFDLNNLGNVAAEDAKSPFTSNSSQNENDVNKEFDDLQVTDFTNFNIDDFDAALNSYQAARAGKVQRVANVGKIETGPRTPYFVEDTKPENEFPSFLSQENSEPEPERDYEPDPELVSEYVPEPEPQPEPVSE